MSGRRINDHSSWIGARGKEYPLPMGDKMKSESSAEGAGAMMNYPDTTEDIKRDQLAGVAKIKSKPMKPGYRY